MSPNTFLTFEEVRQLTLRERKAAQSRQLIALGIQHRYRGDGSVVVLRAHVEQLFGASAIHAAPQQKSFKIKQPS